MQIEFKTMLYFLSSLWSNNYLIKGINSGLLNINLEFSLNKGATKLDASV